MNFYNDDEKKDGAPVAPGAFKKTSSFGKAPLFSRTAGGLMDRLKNLSRKDMAFVGIGLSVLVMAPVAEYMMSKPSTDNLLTPGFGSREGAAPTGLYEPGINALSQGSPDGSGEVITPLSSRDPASLILGSQPAAPVMPPPAPPTTFRDSMKDVGRAAFTEAAKAAPSPTPIPRMSAALRSFGSFFGGGDSTRTSGSLGGGKIIDDAQSASNKAAKRSMVGPVAMPGYKGVASNTPNSSSKGAYEKLRAAADKSAGNFTGGSAISSLDKAAADALNIGAGGGGMGAGGDSEKTTKPSNSNNKYEHNRSGESLAEMAAKQRMQKALDWEFFKQYEIPKQIINAILTGITGPLTKMVDGTVSHIFGLDAQPKPTFCWQPVVCPTGECAAMVEKYHVVAAVDLCLNPGAQKFSWESAGKDKGTGQQVNCICGKQNQPIGIEYKPGTGTPLPGGGQQTPPGGGQQNPPGGGQQTPPNGGQQTGPGTPAAISADALKTFADYDAAMGKVIDNVLFSEEAITKGKKPEEIDTQVKALVSTVAELEGAGSSVAVPKLKDINGKAAQANRAYFAGANAARAEYEKATAAYDAYLKAVAKINADIAAKKLQMNPSAAKEGTAVAENKGRADSGATDVNAEAVKKIVELYDPKIKDPLATAGAQLDYHKFRFEAFGAELGAISADADKIQQSHTAALSQMAQTLTPGEGVAEKLAKASGRPAVAGPTTAATGAAQKDAGAVAGKDSSPQGAEGQKAPLRNVAEDIRGVKWDALWPNDKSRSFDSTAAAAKENKDWAPMLAAINSKQQASRTPTTNFVANAARSGAINAEVASVDFSPIMGFAGTAIGYVSSAKQDLGKIVNACYFGASGCTGSGTGGLGPQGKPVIGDALQVRVNQAGETYKTANNETKAAAQQVAGMEEAIPNTPYASAKAEVTGAYGTLTAAKNDLDGKKASLDAAAQTKDPVKTRAAAAAYEESKKKFDAAQDAFEASYKRAAATTNGMKWTGVKNEAAVNFQTIMNCETACTDPKVCEPWLAAQRTTGIFNAANNYLRIVNDSNASDSSRLSAAEGLRKGRSTACMWIKRALHKVAPGCP